MTPAQHYAEAERLLTAADDPRNGLPVQTVMLAAAQVHATLATATDAAAGAQYLEPTT